MDNLVYNRTIDSYYNKSDIVRVNEHITYMRNNLNLDFAIVEPDWDGYFLYSYIKNILDNLNKLRENWYVAKDTPTTPNANNFDYVKANNIEIILRDLEQFWYSFNYDKIYVGAYISGGNRI